MHTGTRPAGPHHFFNSFFGYVPNTPGPTDLPPRSARIQITPAEGEEDRQNDDQGELDPEQVASAAIRAQEEAVGTFDTSSNAHLPHSISASQIPDQVSVSPAAMFLSSFSSPPVPAPASLPDAEGQVISGYTLGSIIGYGAFSTIRQAYSNSGVVAVKIVRRSDLFKQGNVTLARKRIKREAAVWSTLSHEHVLPLFSVVHTAHSDFFFTLLCPAGSLYDILKRDGQPALPQDDAGMMFRQVVRGLRYLHEVARFVHRDIKLENVLVDENGVCRIGDFGMTMQIGELDEDESEMSQEQETSATGSGAVHRAVSLIIPSRKQPMGGLQVQMSRHRNSTSSPHPATSPHVFQPGSLPYASPELLLPQTSGPLLPHPAQDIWALGILLYGLLMGKLPFADPFEPRLQMKILNGIYDVPPDIGRGAERVIKGCLDRSVHTRWSIAMVDEVAWGIGWGTEGDDVTPAESDEEYAAPQSAKLTKTPSRSRSRCPDESPPENPQWQHDERRSRPSIEVASRRSSSRLQRSISRAPVLASRSSSGRNIIGRSMSRHSRAPSPSFPGLNSKILGSTRPTTPSRPSGFHDSALVTTPPLSLERGRRLKKVHGHSPSPSPSPSAVPSTPTDTRSLATTEVLETESDDFEPERESSRGRRKFSRGVTIVQSPHLFSSGDTAPELDVLDETVGWAAPMASHKRSVSVAGHSDVRIPRSSSTYVGWNRFDRSPSKPAVNRVEAYFEKKPSGNSSPAPTSFWSLTAGKFTIPRRTPKSSGDKPTSTLRSASALGIMTRSKSLEYDRDASYLRRSH